MGKPLSEGQMERWEALHLELQSMQEALNGFTLLGVLDPDSNHIASMEEEIDRKTRQALVAYWLSKGEGNLPEGLS